MKKKLFALILSAVLVLSMAGCSSGDTEDNSSSGSAGQENSQQTSSLMDKDTYLAEVEGLNAGAVDFMEAVSTLMDDDVDMEATITAIRDSKEPFVAFSEIDNPPEGYEEAHSRLAEASGEMGDFIDRYADLFQDAIDGVIDMDTEYTERSEALATEMEEITAELGEAMGEVQNIQ